MTDGEIVKEHSLPGSQVASAAYPEAGLLASVSKDWSAIGSGKDRTLTVWRVSPKLEKATAIASFSLDSKRGISLHASVFVDFIDDSRIVVGDSSNTIRVIDFKQKKELLRIEHDKLGLKEVVPVLSPGRRYLAVPSRQFVQIVDLAELELIGLVKKEFAGFSFGAKFSADGQRFAVRDGDHLFVWDLNDPGEPKRYEIQVKGVSGFNNNVDFIDENYVLLSGKALYDLSRQIVVWTYEMSRSEAVRGAVASVENGSFVYAVQGRLFDKSMVIGNVKLPGASVLERLETVDYGDVYSFDAGTKVQLVINCGDDSDCVEKALRELAESRDWVPVPVARDKIVATIKREGAGSASNSLQSGNRNGAIHTEETMSELSLQVGNDVIWGAASQTKTTENLNAPSSVLTRPKSQPSVEFFENVQLPKRLIKAKFLKGFGVSEIGSRGIVEKKTINVPKGPKF